MEEISILTEIAKVSPFLALMATAIVYLLRENRTKDRKIEELNKVIRENDKENLQVLNNVNNTLDKVMGSQRWSGKETAKGIEEIQEELKELTQIKQLISELSLRIEFNNNNKKNNDS